jgi:hypothetical protein
MLRRYWNRPLGAKLILLLALALLLEMLAPWTRVCVATGEVGARKCGWTTAYEGSDFALYAALLALAILGAALAVCVLVKVIVDNEFQTGWAWIGLALALALMLTALIRVRFRWGTRHARPASASPPADPPGAGA